MKKILAFIFAFLAVMAAFHYMEETRINNELPHVTVSPTFNANGEQPREGTVIVIDPADIVGEVVINAAGD